MNGDGLALLIQVFAWGCFITAIYRVGQLRGERDD